MMALSGKNAAALAGGVVFLAAAGALSWMVWTEWSARSDANVTLADEEDIFANFNAEKTFPSKESIAAVKANAAQYAAWTSNAVEFASKGDRTFAAKNGSDFKDEMMRTVRRLAALPGGVKGKIVAEGSIEANFGFEEYLGDNGRIPEDSAVPVLTVQLDTIGMAAETFSKSGVMQIASVRRVERKKPVEEETRGPKKKKKKGEAEEKKGPDCLEYVFEVLARPAGFTAMLDAFASCERFCVVKDLEFKGSADAILDRISAAEAAANQKSAGAARATSRRRRRGLAAAAAEEKEPEKQDRVVSDPEFDAPLRVKFTLAVYDFGRAAAGKE